MTNLHIELCTTLRTGAVQRDELNAHEVLSRSNACRHREVMPASVRNHGVDSPLAIGKAIVGDFEPLKASRASGGGVVHFRQPVRDWSWSNQSLILIVSMVLLTLVALRDRVVRVVASLSTANDMTPPSADLCTSRNRNHRAVLMCKVLVASERSIIDIGDGVVGVWSTDALQLTLIRTIDGDLLKDGVCSSTAHQSGGGDKAESHVEDVGKKVSGGALPVCGRGSLDLYTSIVTARKPEIQSHRDYGKLQKGAALHESQSQGQMVTRSV
jgi:hypothetical protein